VSGWILLAELYLRNQSFQQSLDCVTKGLKAIKENERKLKSSLQQYVPGMNAYGRAAAYLSAWFLTEGLLCVLRCRATTKLQLVQAKVYHLTKRRKEAQELYLAVLNRESQNLVAMMVRIIHFLIRV
jgi:exonuclease VII small subunit